MLALARQIPAADRSTQAGKWEKSRFMGMELTGKTLGVIGCGNIGAIVADRAQGLKMHVIAYDPFLSPDRARDLNVEKVELDALLARADVIPLHVPMTDQARGMIDAKALAQTQRGGRERDRKGVGEGKRVAVSVGLGGRRSNKKKKKQQH